MYQLWCRLKGSAYIGCIDDHIDDVIKQKDFKTAKKITESIQTRVGRLLYEILEYMDTTTNQLVFL